MQNFLGKLQIVLLVGLLARVESIAAVKNCSKMQTAVQAVQTWKQFYAFYKKYVPACIDDGNSELVSATTEKIITSQWSNLKEFDRLASTNPKFKKFVLSHIDQTTSDPKAIADLAHTRCPKGLDILCKDISKEAKQALIE